MKKLIPTFEALSRDEILAFPAGMHGDFELFSVCEYFDKMNDRDRGMAVYELVLRSPEVSETVAYGQLYFEVANYYRREKQYLKAVQWCYALIAFDEQHDEGLNRVNHRLDLADNFLEQGAFDLSLKLYTQILCADAGNPWIYNELGLVLPEAGLGSLAVEVLDQGLKLVVQNDPEALKDQFEDLRDDAIELASDTPSRVDEITPAVLADFRKALQLPAKIKGDEHDDLPYPPLIARLTEMDAEAAFDEIIAEGQLFVPALIQLAYAENKAGVVNAISLLRTIQASFPGEFKFLSAWFDQAEGNWREELLSSKMGKIGGYTTQALQASASDTRKDNDIRSAASAALVERAQRLPEQCDEVIAFFRELLTRPESYEASEENFVARLVGDCIDLNARELYPEIKQVFDEDRLESGWITLDDIHFEWEMPRMPSQARVDGFYLPLLCKECGRTREHFSEYVLVDTNSLGEDISGSYASKYDAHILDHEIVCPKCGSVDQYELTSMAHFRMTTPDDLASIFQRRSGKKTKPSKGNPRVFYFRSTVFGKNMHPLDGLDEYRRRIALDPDNALLHAKMGALLRTLMRYPEALQTMRFANQLDPDDPEVIIRLALTEHDLGDRDTAQALYQKIIEQANDRPFFPRVDENVAGAMEGLRNLKRNQPSPAEITLHLRDGTPVPHPSILWRQIQLQTQSPALTQKTSKGKTKRGRRKRNKK